MTTDAEIMAQLRKQVEFHEEAAHRMMREQDHYRDALKTLINCECVDEGGKTIARCYRCAALEDVPA